MEDALVAALMVAHTAVVVLSLMQHYQTEVACWYLLHVSLEGLCCLYARAHKSEDAVCSGIGVEAHACVPTWYVAVGCRPKINK